ncbi:uncharacterized protein BXZ73DRAFT_97456 [Epithele typhae]|uniref:uncharacterized protein n=1 Tax=Epithele typhae TaxID=378194 RepID=UPI002008525B|nr:uncharacterized protein BXZ73DRAFT_97456 [Epithele typhae]KAH9943415.1 hypothetical protein BXZ73DRAFT_97456 [Epithele typhae]
MPAPATVLSTLLLAAAALANPHAHAHADHAHTAAPCPAAGDGVSYAQVGTPEWSASFPTPGVPIQTSQIPQAWLTALSAAKSAGKVPSLAPSTQAVPYTNPTYPGQDPNNMPVCSATYKCRNPEDLWDAPDGVFGSSFDDGPLDTSMPLYNLLHENNLVTTHFMIGVNILSYPTEFLFAFQTLQSDIAVHTWTHPYMTTLSDEQVVAELGFTMQLIHNSTSGRLPKYWRPPFGDSDERVRAIAKEVFGLRTVIWNQDTEDWSIGEAGGATRPQVDANLQKWITGPKSPGLIILEHELSNDTTGAFIQAFPLIAQNGWKFESLARLDGGDVYHNSPDSKPDSEVLPGVVGASFSGSVGPISSSGSGAPATTATSGKNNVAQTTTKSAASSTKSADGSSKTSGALAGVSPVSAALAAFAGVLSAALALSS